MKTFAIITTLTLATLCNASAESTPNLQFEREMKLYANAAAEKALAMSRLVTFDRSSLSSQRVLLAELNEGVNVVLDRATRLATSMSYSEFNSVAGLQLVMNIRKLAAEMNETTQFLNQSPEQIHSGAYLDKLNSVRQLCEELAE
jgi:thymidylate kinase